MPITPVNYAPRNYARGGSLGEILRLRGRDAADAELRSGEIQARLWSDLGQTIAGGINSYAKEKQEAPIRAQEAKARELNIQRAEGEVAAQQRDTRALSTQNALMPLALKTGDDGIATFDEDLLTREFATAGIADRLPSVLKSLGDFRTSAVQFKKLQGDMQAAQVDTIANLAFGALEAGGTLQAAQRVIELLDANGIVSKAEAAKALEGITDDASMQKRLTELAQTSPAVRQEMEARRARKATETLAGVTAAATAADRQADNARADAASAEAARHNKVMEARPPAGSQPAFQAKEVLGDDGKPVMASFDPRSNKWITPAGQAIANPRPVPSAMETQDARKFKQAGPILSGVSELSEKINTGKGLLAKVSGRVERAKAQANYNDDVAEYDALISGFTPLVARALGHTGVLTQQDVDSVKALFPKPGDSKTLRDRKIARINGIIGDLESGADPTAVKPPATDPNAGWTVINGIRVREKR